MTVPLWTAADAASATGGIVQGDWSSIHGISIDTREIAAGDLFVALIGENRDGHDFAQLALDAGAAAVMVSRRPDGSGPDAPLLIVDDTLQALRRLAAAARARTGAWVIGVTGSVGKTSTKDMLRTMLAPQGRTHAAVRSFNNHWGVPLTLARMPVDTEYAVIEIGMNQPGEITPLSRLARPDVALITNVEAVHMAAFDSVEQIADAKAEIFAGVPRDGTVVLNADNPHFCRLSNAASPRRVVTVGATSNDWRLVKVSSHEDSFSVETSHNGQDFSFTIGAPGAHFALNALGALAAAVAVGADRETATYALADWTPPQGRGSRVTIDLSIPCGTGAITLLDESYNANPASMRAALAVLGRSTGARSGRRLAYLGDMLELGPDEMAIHADLAALPDVASIDLIHCCGTRMRALHEALPDGKRGIWVEDSTKLAEALPQTVDAGDICMVKGSLGARMAVVVAAIKALGQERNDTPDGNA